MELGVAGLDRQPFGTDGKPLVMSSYAAHRSAFDFLKKTYEHRFGLGLLEGPTLSGKSTILQHFVDTLGEDVCTAIVEADGITPQSLLEAVLDQFGYQLELTSVNELLSMLRVFAMQQASARQPPLLVVENTQALNADALRLLCQIAEFRVKRRAAMRIVLASDRPIDNIIDAPAMEKVSKRVTGRHRLGPMASLETRDYLHAMLSAAGSMDPAGVMPDEVCVHLYSASGGWPGVVDRLAKLALARAEECPIANEHVERTALEDLADEAPPAEVVPSEGAADGRPHLYVSVDGKLLGDVTLDSPRLLIGRSEHNDLRINSHFISRHHAMFVRHGSATLLMDLNSTNGTFVNSRRVSNYVMRHDDIVSIGNHRIKFVHAAAERKAEQDDETIADTVIMKTLEDMREMYKKESTQTMPLKTIEKLASSDAEKS